MDNEQGVRRIVDQSYWWENIEWSGMESIVSGFLQNGVLILSLILGVALIIFLVKRIHFRRNQIQKLWVFILFFLTKRQMMIPLVIRLSEKDQLLDNQMRAKLMEIRQLSRDTSFKKYPNQRLAVEEEVSTILFHYFSTLEKQSQIQPGTKFAKLVKDLEFIDAKLVQLQKVYNNEAHRWNRFVDFPVISFLSRLIGATPFRPFK